MATRTEALFTGSGWSILIRWFARLLGLISLSVCARVLGPSDYGLIAMVMVVVAFATIIVEFGIDAALIRIPNPSKEVYNTAWSLRIIQGAIVSSLLIVLAPLAVSIYDDERVLSIIVVIAVATFFGGMQNIYVVDFRKRLDFRSDFVFSIIPKLVSFVIAIALVLTLKSYWGLVWAICASELAKVVASYLLIPKRASWQLSEWRSLTTFSGWYFVRGLGDFFTHEFDRLLLGALGGPTQTGVYAVGREVASLPGSEIVMPIGRALLPTLSQIAHDTQRLKSAVNKAIAGTLLVAIPASVGLALIAKEFVFVVFGSGWENSIALVMIFSISSIFAGFKHIASNIFVVTGRMKVIAMITWLQAFLFLAPFYYIFIAWGMWGIAAWHVAAGFLICFFYALVLKHDQLMTFRNIAASAGRPIAGSLVMSICLIGFDWVATGESVVFLMLLKVVVGMAAYILAILFFWILAGRPNSIERVVWSMMLEKAAPIFSKNQATK